MRGPSVFCQDEELREKRAGAPPAKDVAEALGIAAGAQSGWLGARAAPAPLDPAQRQVSADLWVPRCSDPNLEPSASTWTHENTEEHTTECTDAHVPARAHAGV